MSSPPCRQDIALSRIADQPGYVDVMLTYRCSSEVTGLTPYLPESADVNSTKGFRQAGRKCVWDGTTELPTVTFEMEVTEGGPAGRDTVDTGNWALIQAPRIRVTYQRTRSATTTTDFGEVGAGGIAEEFFGDSSRFPEQFFGQSGSPLERRYHVHDRGIVSEDGAVVYLGPHDLYTQQVGTQEVRLVVPVAASLAEDPSDILSALERMALSMGVRGKNDTVIGVAAPTEPVSWGPAGQKRGKNGFWARDSSPLDRPNSTWLHEYVHTRQEFDARPETMWLVEGTAVFYATYHAHRQGLITDADFQRALNTSMCADDVLASPQRGWSSAHTPYKKGARVTAWLDRRIRDETDGSVGFDGVFRAMNFHDGGLTHDDFLDLVAAAMGLSRSSRRFGDIERDIELFVRDSEAPDTVGPPGSDPLPESEVGTTGVGIAIEDVLEELVTADGAFEESNVFTAESLDRDLFDTDELFVDES